MNTPTSAPVPVVPATPGHVKSKWLALTLMTLGMLVNFIMQAEPQIIVLFPGKKWVPPFISLIGIAWYTIIHGMDSGSVQSVNYSPPPPPPSTPNQ